MSPSFQYRGLRLFVTQGHRRQELELAQVNHFAAEMDHFSGCVLNDKAPRTPGEEGLADMRILQAIDEATRTGKAVRVKS